MWKGMKRTLSSANPSAAQNLYSYKEQQYNAQYDKIPWISKDVTKCSMILPTQYGHQALSSCIDEAMLEGLEQAKRINWCESSRYLLPMHTLDDGNCFFHAASMYMFGVHDSDLTFRKLVYQWLFMDKANEMMHARWKINQNQLLEKFHVSGLPSHLFESSWLDMIDHCSERRYECNDEIRYQSPDAFHAFVLANILCRPIIIFCCDSNQGDHVDKLKAMDFQGVYLPLLRRPELCEKSPIVIGYQSGHFAPLLSSENITLPVCRTAPSRDAVHVIPLICFDLTMMPIKFCMADEEGRLQELLVKYLELCDVPYRQRQIVSALLKFKPPPAWSIELLWSFHKLVEQEQLPRGLDEISTNVTPCARKVVTQCQNPAANNKENLCIECYEQFLDKKRKIPKRNPSQRKQQSPGDYLEYEKTKTPREGYVGRCKAEGCFGIPLPDLCQKCSSKSQMRTPDYEYDTQVPRRNHERDEQELLNSVAGAGSHHLSSSSSSSTKQKILCCIAGCRGYSANDGYCDIHYENLNKPKVKCAMPDCTNDAEDENEFNLCVYCFRSQGNILKDFEREKTASPDPAIYQSQNMSRGPQQQVSFDFTSFASSLPPLPKTDVQPENIPPIPEMFEPPTVYTGFSNRSGHQFGGQYGVMNWQKERVRGGPTGRHQCHYCVELSNPNKDGLCDKCFDMKLKGVASSSSSTASSPLKKCINDGCRLPGIERNNYLCEKCYEKHFQEEMTTQRQKQQQQQKQQEQQQYQQQQLYQQQRPYQQQQQQFPQQQVHLQQYSHQQQHQQQSQQPQDFRKPKMVDYNPCKTPGCIRMALAPTLFCDDCKEHGFARRGNEPIQDRGDMQEEARQICKALDCDFYGSDEYGGYCSTCFMEITKKDAMTKKNSSNRTFAPNHPLAGMNEVHSFPVAQGIAPPLPCRSQSCAFSGRPEWNGFCSLCYKTHHVERDS